VRAAAWPALAWLAGAGAAFAVYLRLAQTRAVNSDGASQALQAWDMLHGNPLLRGWTVSDVSFYPTELPQYALVELVGGLRADVVDIAAAMTYTLAVLLAALVARGTATGRQALLRVAVAAGIMLAPQLGAGTNVLLSSPDHIGTSVPLLLTWLVLDRGRRRWYLPLITPALLAWADVADSITLVAGILPLALVCGARGARAARAGARGKAGYELAMAGGALAAAGAARLILGAVTAAGGFTVRPLSTQVAPLSAILGHNLPAAGRCVLVLFGADAGSPLAGEAAFFLLLHLAGVTLAVAGVAVAAWRVRRGLDLAGQVLLAAIAVNLAAFGVTERAVDLASAREIAPVLPFAAALAARELSPALGRVRWRPARLAPGPARTAPLSSGAGGPRLAGPVLAPPVLAGPVLAGSLLAGPVLAGSLLAGPVLAGSLLAGPVLAVIGIGYAAGLGLELTAPAAPPQGADLTAWLRAHDLGGSGLAGYWQASVVTLTSGGTVAIRPIADVGDGIGPHPGEVSDAWFDPGRSRARFVVMSPGEPGYPGYADYQAALATWGAPARVYHVGPYTIWYWPKNLLSTIRRLRPNPPRPARQTGGSHDQQVRRHADGVARRGRARRHRHDRRGRLRHPAHPGGRREQRAQLRPGGGLDRVPAGPAHRQPGDRAAHRRAGARRGAGAARRRAVKHRYRHPGHHGGDAHGLLGQQAGQGRAVIRRERAELQPERPARCLLRRAAGHGHHRPAAGLPRGRSARPALETGRLRVSAAPVRTTRPLIFARPLTSRWPAAARSRRPPPAGPPSAPTRPRRRSP
jgi:hypothetical protein